MTTLLVKTHTDGVWISLAREEHVVEILSRTLIGSGFDPVIQNPNDNYGYACMYQRNDVKVHCRVVDSVFMSDHTVWDDPASVIITDNHAIKSLPGQVINVLPEFWSIWKFDPEFVTRPAQFGFNCFMNRPRGDRSLVFYELIKRNLLCQGIVSFNCDDQDYETQYLSADLHRYQAQHEHGRSLIPYNTVEQHGTLEQCMIDSNVSLILETYTCDDHIVFSEKIFRCLQMPRPWLLYCSPGSIELLRNHGFDVLDDCVDHSYDTVVPHHDRLALILDQLETFIGKNYSQLDYQRFQQSADHNQTLLTAWQSKWPSKLQTILKQIHNL